MNTFPLWRRCRVLANSLRLDMLELLDGSTNRCVKEIAEALGIAEDVASKNLQLLASAGFMTRKHAGKYLYYGLAQNDILLIEVLELAHGTSKDRAMFTVTALTHARRIAILKVLGAGPRKIEELGREAEVSWIAIRRQLDKLERRGFVRVENGRCALITPGNALGKRMVELVLNDDTPAQV